MNSQEIRPLNKLEQLQYLKEFLETDIKNKEEELEEVKIKIKKLEVNNENKWY